MDGTDAGLSIQLAGVNIMIVSSHVTIVFLINIIIAVVVVVVASGLLDLSRANIFVTLATQ
jgi:hypothetical protein